MHPTLASLCLAAAMGALVTAQPAAAAIQCEGPNQVVQGQLLSTPYCRDTYLAQVANSYGMRVSAHAVRWNPSVKKQVCAAIGYDIRVQDACIGYRSDSGRQFR